MRKTRLLHDEFNWRGYCRAIALGSGADASYAKLCVSLGKASPSAARVEAERRLISGDTDAKGYRTLVDAVDRLEAMYDKGIQTHYVQNTDDLEDWHPLSHGGHMRVTHLSSNR